ncbi:MAG: enoyl-CoA hydratase/isomerase family protein [Nitrospirae bacterium]|nr:enoyl-CoA hydratase/isomerase family protein [Nitrospirota bacterium]
MTPEKTINLSVNDRSICHVEIDVPGKAVNVISAQVLAELSAAVDSIQSDPGIKGVIFLSRKPDHFIGGADIDAQKFLGDLESSLAFAKQGQDVYQKIAELPVPTLAAIHGACLGGGLELALACRYRLASDHRKTRMGLPEVMLGLLPAWGGTTRLPRLIGLSAALDLLLTGKQLDAKRAERIGLVDRVITDKEISTQADAFMSELTAKIDLMDSKIRSIRHQAQNKMMARFLNHTPVGRFILLHQARKNVLTATKGRYPAPLKIIEVVQNGFGGPIGRSLDLEQEGLKTLAHEETTRNLLHVFSLRIHAGKLPHDAAASKSIPSIRKVGVLGAGVMGAGIAQWFLQQGIPVRLRDINEGAVAKGIKSINEAFDKLVSRRRLRPEEKADRMRLLSAATSYSGFSKSDLVIEAVAERMEIKQRVIRELQEAAGERAVFATNTSSLSVSAMAEASKRPDRVLGLHFFNPVSQMPLVEIVKGRQTSDETVAAGVAFVKQIGKTPLIVSDSPGFLVNRILMAYGNEAGLLLEEGAAADRTDRVMESFGMPMGPFTMLDLVGLDIAYHTAETIRTALRLDWAQQSRIGDRLFDAGRFGKKTGQGFYRYEGRQKIANPELAAVLAAVRKDRGITPRPNITDQEITERLLMIMVNTAAWCLETEVVTGPGDVDLGLIMGAGFPPFRGGLLKYCDKIGMTAVKEALDRYARSAGSRFSPARMIKDRAQQAKGFY